MNHFNVSMIKSIIRIMGYLILINNIVIGSLMLLAAELLGIVEELVDKRK